MAKRLYKSQNKKIGGVCAGIAEYCNADPTIIRLLWVVVTLIGIAPGIIAYIVCALIIPERPSSEPEWDTMKRANEYTEKDKEFDSYFEKEKKQSKEGM